MLQIILALKDKFSGPLGSAGASAKKFGKTVKTAMTAAIGALTAVGVGAFALAKKAADVEGIRAGFRGLTDDADKMMTALRAGAAGMASDAELMKSYNQAAQLVSKTVAQQLPEAFGVLQKVSRATGQSFDYMLNSLVTGIGRESKMILDNLAITVDVTAAKKAYAASIGKTVSALTTEEGKIGLMNQVMEKLRANTASMPSVTGTFAASITQLKTRIANLIDRVGQSLIPVFEELWPIIELVTDKIEKLITSDEAKEMLIKLADSIRDLHESITNIDPDIKEAALNLIALGNALGKVVGPLNKFVKAAQQQKFHQVAEDINEVSEGVRMLIGWAESSSGAMEKLALPWEQIDFFEDKLRELVITLPGGVAALETLDAMQGQVSISTGNMAGITALNTDALRAETVAMREAGAAAAATADLLAKGGLDEETLRAETKAMQDKTQAVREASAAAAEMAQVETGDITGEATETAIAARMAAYEQIGLAAVESQAALEASAVQHEQALLNIQQQGAMTALDSQFNFNLQMAQSEQAYQSQRQALLAAGKTDEAAKLQESHTREQALARNAYTIQQQLQERAILQQKVVQQRAYVAELEAQYKKATQSLNLAQVEAETEGKIEIAGQIALLKTQHKGGVEAVDEQRKIAEDKVKAFTAGSKGMVQSAISAAEAVRAARQEDLGAARAHLKELEDQLANFRVDLPEIPAPDFSQFEGAVGDMGEIAGRDTGQAATRVLANVAADIDKAVEHAKNAIRELVDFDVPVGVEAGIEKLAAFVGDALQPFYEALKKVDVDAREGAEALNASIATIVPALKAMGEIGTFIPTVDLRAKAAVFVDQVGEMMPELGRLPDLITEEAIPAIQRFTQGGMALLSTVKPGIEAIKAMLTLGSSERLGERSGQFVDDLTLIITELKDLQTSLDAGDASGLAKFSENLEGALGYVKSGMAAIEALMQYGMINVVPRRMANLREYLEVMIGDVIEMSGAFSAEALAKAQQFGLQVQEIMGIVTGAVGAIRALGEIETADVDIDRAFGQISAYMNQATGAQPEGEGAELKEVQFNINLKINGEDVLSAVERREVAEMIVIELDQLVGATTT